MSILVTLFLGVIAFLVLIEVAKAVSSVLMSLFHALVQFSGTVVVVAAVVWALTNLMS